MKEWIGYYEDVLSNELSKNIISDTWEWKPSTYSTHEGISPNSKNKVVMDDCWITEKMETIQMECLSGGSAPLTVTSD